MIRALVIALCSLFIGAQADQKPPPKPLRTVIFPFASKPGKAHDDLARIATAAFEAELATHASYVLISQDELARAMGRLRLKPPLKRANEFAIAREIQADLFVDGSVERVETDSRDNRPELAVGLTARVFEVSSEELINGAPVFGFAREGKSPKPLATEAAKQAGYIAAWHIEANRVPEGLILTTTTGPDTGLVISNLGLKHGVTAGTPLSVLRDGVRVASLRAKNVYPDDSESEVIENKLGIRPEDKVRPVFTMPRLPLTIKGTAKSRDAAVPVGEVLTTINGLGVSVGSRNGVTVGSLMFVFRKGVYTATIRATLVYPEDCEAEVIENKFGIRPTDEVRMDVESQPHTTEPARGKP